VAYSRRWLRRKTNGKPRNRQVNTGNLAAPAQRSA
jgi:hypothetical protein